MVDGQYNCCLCARLEDTRHQHRFLAVFEATDGVEPGLYHITRQPYFATGTDGELIDSAVSRVSDVPSRSGANGHTYGHLCLSCQAEWVFLMPDLIDEMRKLHFVVWDRFAESEDEVCVYGWIRRDDGRDDFVVLQANDHGIGYITSSQRWSVKIGLILGGGYETGHKPCRRVEHFVSAGLGNVIRREGW